MSTPVVVLAFSNNRDAYLENVERERKSLAKSLRGLADNSCIRVSEAQGASTADVFELFNHYDGQIAVFHYGGHADGGALQFEADGQAETAHAGGLAQAFGKQTGLQLVFLNGCATKGQVEALQANGVKVVIATAVPIDDQMATEFAEQFYDALANRQSIGRAFASARQFVATKYGPDKPVGEFRALSWAGQTPQTAEAGLTWGLYVHPDGGEAALDWTLPQAPQQQIIIRGQTVTANPSTWLNVNLQKTLLEALQKTSPQFAADLESTRNKDDFDERDIPPLIINVFPLPIGEQLRILFSGRTVDVARLQQLVLTYEMTVKLFCFAVLAQLWDIRIAKPDLKIADEQRAVLNSFMTLTADNTGTYDYLKLIVAVVAIFKSAGVTPFMTECARLDDELNDGPSQEAHAFMEEMRTELRSVVAAEEIASFCEQAEKHLGTLLSDFAFVALYKPTTIKSIEIAKFRNEPARYTNNQVALDKAGTDSKDSQRTYDSYTDSGSVILQKDRRVAEDYVNLTPFIVDENALLNFPASKLYFLSHYTAQDDTYHYAMVSNPEVALLVNADNHPRVKGMFDEFKATVLNA